jgi:hypothetical protein
VGPLLLSLGCIDCAALVPSLVRYPPTEMVLRLDDRYPDRASTNGSWEAQVRTDSDLSVHMVPVPVLVLVLEAEPGDEHSSPVVVREPGDTLLRRFGVSSRFRVRSRFARHSRPTELEWREEQRDQRMCDGDACGAPPPPPTDHCEFCCGA